MDALNGKRLVILGMARQGMSLARFAVGAGAFVTPVSYTHLTLPTSDLV